LKPITITLLAAVFLIPSSAFSQTRSRSSRPKPPTQAQQAQRVSQVRMQGATRVAEQVKNLARFTYLLGGINNTINASTCSGFCVAVAALPMSVNNSA